jgi:hypothetical protein
MPQLQATAVGYARTRTIPPERNGIEMSFTPEDRNWLTAELQIIHQKIEHVETTLLTEFYKWASPNENRQRRYSAELREFESRLDYIEDRLKQLERPRQ